ncbi:MAG TPA: hypothetical protein PLU72_02090 [Candidatus Ozemobacteraceae bacterium]|nr:hypothetical protein [Candidatus Ozemobacteraceae bacterium]
MNRSERDKPLAGTVVPVARHERRFGETMVGLSPETYAGERGSSLACLVARRSGRFACATLRGPRAFEPVTIP